MMLKRAVLLGCLIGSCLFLFLAAAGDAEGETITVAKGPLSGADYNTIQEAVDAAAVGDSIHVSPGIYYENVVVNKSIYLFGEDRNTTVINGDGTGHVVHVTADDVTIAGFMIRGSGNGNDGGLCFDGATLGWVSDNVITDNMANGILLMNGTRSIVISGNDISGNNFEGIWMWNSSGNVVTYCDVTDNYVGITIWQGEHNTVVDCNIDSNSVHGLYLPDTYDNDILLNNISGNGLGSGYGIFICSGSTNNTLHRNNFENNRQHASDQSHNQWDDGGGIGNYWDNYSGSDNDRDGIGDSPLDIPGGSSVDRWPLMQPYWMGLLADDVPPEVVSTVPSDDSTEVATGTTITIRFSEEMNVTLASNPISTYPDFGYSLSWSEGNTTLYIAPDDDLNISTTYSITLTVAFRDMAGLNITPYTFSFTTEEPDVNEVGSGDGGTNGTGAQEEGDGNVTSPPASFERFYLPAAVIMLVVIAVIVIAIARRRH